MSDPIDTDAMRVWLDAYYPNGNHLTLQYRLALAEVDRLRADAMAKAHRVGELGAEVDLLRDVLVDIAASVPAAHRNDGRDVSERIRDGAAAEADVEHLRDLLAKALPWIDPNDRHEDYLLTVEIRQALGEES